MYLLLILFMAFSTYLVAGYKTKLAYISAMYFVGCAFVIVAGYFYFCAMGIYSSFSKIDSIFFKWLYSFKVNVYSAAIIHNIGIMFLMSAGVICIVLVYKINWKKAALLTVPMIFVFIANLPSVKWYLYIYLNSSNIITEPAKMEVYIKKICIILFLIYIIMPLMTFSHYSLSTKIFYKRRGGVACIWCICLIYLLLFLLLYNSAFAPTMFYNISLMGLPKIGIGTYSEKMFTFAYIVAIFIINIVILLQFKPFEKLGLKQKRKFIKQSNSVNENVFMLLHTYKNKFVCIEKLVSQGVGANERNAGDEIKLILDNIKKEADESVENISRTLRALSTIRLDYNVFIVEKCIDEAVLKFSNEFISFEKVNNNGKTIVFGSKEYIVESLVNLFRNSIESIEQKGIINGKISVKVYNEQDMVLITVRDNGNGISKRNIGKVFKPFYTTKNQKLGNGLGLDFVKKICRIHSGDVMIKSRENEYTEVSIALPVYVTKNK